MKPRICGGGDQNQLRPEDIDLIINTYRGRENIEKYSRVADLSEVAENAPVICGQISSQQHPARSKAWPIRFN